MFAVSFRHHARIRCRLTLFHVQISHRFPWLAACGIFCALILLYALLNSSRQVDFVCPGGEQPFDDEHTLVNLTDFDYLIRKPPVDITFDKNGVQIPSFVVIIHSSPYQQAYRDSMRSTWSQSDPRALVYFALGAVNTTRKQMRIEAEDRKHGDIIQGNFYDSYRNLTYKHTMVLKWFKHNANGIKHLVKLDDDVYAHVPGVYKYITALPERNERFVAAPVMNPHPMVRDSKYKITMDESSDNYTVTYGIGNQVIYSYDAVVAIHDRTAFTRFFPMDDMYILGYIRIALNIGFTELKSAIFEDVQQLIADGFEPPADWCFTSATVHNFEGAQIWQKMKKYRYQSPR